MQNRRMKILARNRRLIILFIVGGLLEIAALMIDQDAGYDSILAYNEKKVHQAYEQLEHWPPILRGDKGFYDIIDVLASINPIETDVHIPHRLKHIALAIQRGGSVLAMDKDNGKYIQIKVIIANRVLGPNEKPRIINGEKLTEFDSALQMLKYRSNDFLLQMKKNIEHRILFLKWLLLIIGLCFQSYGVYREIKEKN